MPSRMYGRSAAPDARRRRRIPRDDSMSRFLPGANVSSREARSPPIAWCRSATSRRRRQFEVGAGVWAGASRSGRQQSSSDDRVMRISLPRDAKGYSARSVVIGSTRDALNAGMRTRGSRSTPRRTVIATNVTGSRGSVANSNDRHDAGRRRSRLRGRRCADRGKPQASRHDDQQSDRSGDAPTAEPNRQLAPAPRHPVRRHAVDADRGNQHRADRECAAQACQESRPRNRVPDHLRHRPRLENRHVRIDVPYAPPDLLQRRRFAAVARTTTSGI